MLDFTAELRRVFVEFLRLVIETTPVVLLVVVTGLLGIVLAWLFERLVVALMRRKHVAQLLESSGFAGWLERAGVKAAPDRFMGRVAFWVFLLMLVRTAAYVFDLVPISQAIGTFLAYLPHLLAAILILLLGAMLARVVAAAVRRGTEGAGSDVSNTLGGVVYGIVMYSIVIMALSEMGIDTEVVRVFSVIVLASLGLAFGLGFGLGARRTFENAIASYHVRRSFGIGDVLELPEGTGPIERVTATQTFLKLDSGELVLSSSELLERTKYRRARRRAE